MKKVLKIIQTWIFVFLWLGLIFYFSNMNSNESNVKSKETIQKVIETTVETGNKVGITEEVPTKEEQLSWIEILNLPLRKFMHMMIYCILSLLVINALNKQKIKHKYFITVILCVLYAITDEYHQTFITGRTGQLFDVIIDTIGILIGVFLKKKGEKNEQIK